MLTIVKLSVMALMTTSIVGNTAGNICHTTCTSRNEIPNMLSKLVCGLCLQDNQNRMSSLDDSAETRVFPPKHGKIVGGHVTEKGRYKFAVSLLRRSSNPKLLYHFCGGSLITAQTILTAAHCLASVWSVNDVFVSVGDHNLLVREEGEKIVQVVQLIIHPQYDAFSFNNDIAIVRINPLAPELKVSTIPYNTDNKILEMLSERARLSLTVLGWGSLYPGGPTSSLLSSVSVPYVNRGTCSTLMRPYSVTDGMICAGDILNGGKDACQGDSGGPIIYSKKHLEELAKILDNRRTQQEGRSTPDNQGGSDQLQAAAFGSTKSDKSGLEIETTYDLSENSSTVKKNSISQTNSSSAIKSTRTASANSSSSKKNRILTANSRPGIKKSSTPPTNNSPESDTMTPPTNNSPESDTMTPPTNNSPESDTMTAPTNNGPESDTMTPPTNNSPESDNMTSPTNNSPESDIMTTAIDENMENDDKYVLAGVVSWGVGCAEPGLAGIYTNVPQFAEWISQNTV